MSLMKNLYITLSAAALILAAASCVKDTNTETVLDNARRYELSFAPFTKTEISGTGTSRSVSWSEGDFVRYYTESNQSSPSEATVSLSGDKAYVTIPPGRTDEFINAVYGATQLKSSSSTEKCMYVTSPVKSDQRYTTFAEAHVCAAFSSDLEDPNLCFHNAVCIIHFTSAADVHKVVFSGNNGEIINGGSTGDLKISYSGGALTVESAASGSNATNQTTVTIATNGEEADFYFAILPVCFDSGIAVQCYDSYGSLMFTKKTSSTLNTVTSSGAVKILNLGKAQDWIATAPPEPVDLGLSVKWANYNVGASKPEDYGDYFSWGETSPKTEYKWANYLYGTAKNGPFSKYVLNSDYGTVDHKLVLDLEDDAAHANWGGDWRMPTKEEVEELMTKCTWAWTTRNGINGYTVTGNGNSIFLPANGMRSSSIADEGTVGNYWSSSISGDGTYYSISPYFSQSYKKSGNCYRYFGLGVRPVYGAIVPVSEITLPETLTLTMGIKDSETLTAIVLPDNATYKSVSWASSNESVATVDASGNVMAISIGTTTIKVYSADASTAALCEVAVTNAPIIDEYEYVDLGLPSGRKWATCNIGATSPEEYGSYFAWGETEPKQDYSWTTYKWVSNGDGYKLTKYCKWYQYWRGEGEMDGADTLIPEDDAAYVNWGHHWRMPTVAEFQELMDKCTWEWTYINNVSGWLAISTINSRSIFFPAASHYYGTTIWPGSSGYPVNTWYWTNYTDDAYHACDFDFINDSEYATHGTMLMRTQDRCKGAVVRAVYQE